MFQPLHNQVCAMHPDHISVFTQTSGTKKRKIDYRAFISDEDKSKAMEKFLNSKRKAGGKLSDNAKRKLIRAIDYLLFISQPKTVINPASGKKFRFKVNFITLTLSSEQIHSDKEITNTLLNQFLTEIRQEYKLRFYVYRAEKQKNGNIHFHILTDIFIPYTTLRDKWNRIQNKLGYVDRYKENMLKWHSAGFKFRPELSKFWSYESQLKAYKAGIKSGFNRPNSTDIHSLKNIRNVRQYLIKYMIKTPEENLLTDQDSEEKYLVVGRVWSCSQSLSKIKGYQADIDSFIAEMLSRLKRCSAVKIIEKPYFSVFYFDIQELLFTDYEYLFIDFVKYLNATFNINYQLSIT